MASSWSQLRALVAVRWQMTRSRRLRSTLLLLPVLLMLLLYVVVSVAGRLTGDQLVAAVAIAPAVFLGFVFLAVLAPLTLSGGNELVPFSQLIAYPVTSRTQYLAGLLLAPLNLVWVLQLLGLAGETACLARHGHLASAAVTTGAFVVATTAAGQAVAWAVAGLRPSRRGRRGLALTAGAGVLVVGTLLLRREQFGALATQPAHLVTRALTVGPGLRWAATTAALVLAAVVALMAGDRACGWALSTPDERTGRGVGVLRLRLRTPRRSQLGQLIAVDLASVWRAPALRRSGLTLLLLSSLLAVGAAVSWQFLIVLPGLAASAAGLLFGINAFSLDGSGALWLASLPHPPRLVVLAKLTVLTITVTGGIVIAEGLAVSRADAPPSATELTALAMSAPACGALVVATCLAISVRRPHRADLTGPRDVIAPPGALVAASARLAGPVCLAGVLLEGASSTRVWWFPLLIGAPILTGALLWLRHSVRAYTHDDACRSHIIEVVSTG
ncbi:MAG: hypothetical protein NVS3B26_10090 [Mycobacteriales bacterium]